MRSFPFILFFGQAFNMAEHTMDMGAGPQTSRDEIAVWCLMDGVFDTQTRRHNWPHALIEFYL
jgi:hypothetical protein